MAENVDPLQGLRVLVVGASSGIGAATTTLLHDHGARVVGAARRVERISELGVDAVPCDLLDPESCARAVAEAVDLLGGLDALVIISGLSMLVPLQQTTHADWQRVLDTNLVGPALVTRAALEHLQAPGSAGRVVFASSDSAALPYPGMVLYGTAKRGLEAFSDGLAHEYPALHSTYVVIGPTHDTEMGRDWDPELLTPWLQRWLDEGYLRFGPQLSAEVAEVFADVLRSPTPPRSVEAVNRLESPEIK